METIDAVEAMEFGYGPESHSEKLCEMLQQSTIMWGGLLAVIINTEHWFDLLAGAIPITEHNKGQGQKLGNKRNPKRTKSSIQLW